MYKPKTSLGAAPISYDLTDRWHGRYAFPRLYEPMEFVADLQQSGEWLSGRTEETALRGPAAGKFLTATISGKVADSTVTFAKLYDAQIGGYDAVQYEGRVADEGREIWGTWSIPGNWSGTFIMVRSKGLPTAQKVAQEERI